MAIVVHHKPANTARLWHLHVWENAWDGNNVWDWDGTASADTIDFLFPDAVDPRLPQFKFHSTDKGAGHEEWESDTFTRQLFRTDATDIWTFENSPRVIYQNPFPVGVSYSSGDILTFHVLTRAAFQGGQIYVWDTYNPTVGFTSFPETARDNSTDISTFVVTLLPWMTSGFHLKLMKAGTGGATDIWEADTANRVWRPCDGSALWLKSGQCDVRDQPLSLTPMSLEILYSALTTVPPQMELKDMAEQSTFPITAINTAPYPASPLFRIATYSALVYPGAAYTVTSQQSGENPPLPRPFPATPSVLSAVSRCVLGASAWLGAFPPIATIPLSIQPQAVSSFQGGLSVEVSLGNGPVYDTVAATQQPDGTWEALLPLALNTTTAFDLSPTAGPEPKPYEWIDTSRYFTPDASMPRLYTTEGVYGICSRRPTQFTDPPNRVALMAAAFGRAVVAAGVFDAREMPAGVTLDTGEVYFVVHAPHAICGTLILVSESPGGIAVRTEHPMFLTTDTFYWWCSVPAAQAPPSTPYRFLLNDKIEVNDPAARAVVDGGNLKAIFGEIPASSGSTWSVVLDVDAVSTIADASPQLNLGWHEFLIYEIHARRFTNFQMGALEPLGLLADELNAISRYGRPGYLHQLPVTVLELMPVSEFSGAVSWGYDPSFYFAVDQYYGGARSLAGFVNAAHVLNRGVMLDVVYNHSLGSPLMSIAPDVYRNGDYDGDRMNCGHPMVREYFRQASVYLFRTFRLDGFRFDDTNTITTKCVGGWEFLEMIRTALRKAASAENRAWPYCVAENSATAAWDISNPAWGVMDSQWDIDEAYAIRDASYGTWPPGTNQAGWVKSKMDEPREWNRPFFQAVRFGESHDMVSAQDAGNKRIAARPPYRQGYQMAKALGTLTLLSNGVPMLFMGQEVGETIAFSFPDNDQWINPQNYDVPPYSDNSRVLAWFRQIMGLRNDPSKGLQGDANYMIVATGNRTIAFSCGLNSQRLFTVVTLGTPDQQQNSSSLGLPAGAAYKEIFNSSWPDFQVEFEPEHTNGGYDARIYSGNLLNLPYIGAVVLERI